MSFGGGGGGGQGTQRYEWNEDMAPYWRSILERANRGANTELYPYNPYNPNNYGSKGQQAGISRDPSHGVYRQLGGFFNDPSITGRVAGINDDQASAMANIRALALGHTDAKGQYTPPGGQQSGEARNYLSGLLSGKMEQNPWMGSTPLDRTYGAGGAYNMWAQGNPLAQAQNVPGMYDKAGPQTSTVDGTVQVKDPLSRLDPDINKDQLAPQKQTQTLDPSVIEGQVKAGQNASRITPQTQAERLSVNANQYAGMDSPYFNKQLDTGLKKITDAYNKGTDAQTRRMFNLAGAFGGGAHQQAVKDNEEVLAEQLGNFTNNMQQQQYDRSANLAESDIGRRMQAGQFNIGVGDRNIDRDMSAQQFNVGTGDRNIDRDIAAQQFNLGLAGQNANIRNQAGQFNIGLGNQNIDRDVAAQQFNIGNARQNSDIRNQASMYNIGLGQQGLDRDVDMQKFNLGLAGQNADRRNQMGQFNANLGANAYENWANRAFQGGANDMARRERGMENFLNRDMQSQQFNQNLGFSGYENMRNRQMSAIPMAFQTEGMAMDRLRGLMGVGDAQRSYEQQIKDTAYNEFLARSNYDKSQVDWLSGLLSRAQGGVAPNVTTQYPGTQISPFGALLGAGALYGAMR